MANYVNNYPIILIHGLLGWGEQDGLTKTGVFPYWGWGQRSIDKHIRKKYGTEVFCPSLGPFNSAWDRACIFWAYLFGGTVDFGKVHSEKFGHARYGKTFEHGVLEDLGQTEAHKKINIMGHSFGGPTVKEIQNLFIQGCKEEVEGTPEEELSDLFKGGHGNLLHSVTTLSGVNNGTAFASMFEDKGMTVITTGAIALATMLEKTPAMKMYNFGLQQWGLDTWPEDIKGCQFQAPLSRKDVIKAYDANKGMDAISHEMQIEVIQDEINPSQTMSNDIYYFAHRAYKTHSNGHGGQRPDIFMNPVCLVPGIFTGTWTGPRVEKFHLKGNPDWEKNDGYVNYIGTSAPLNQPHEAGDWQTEFKPGIWYNMEPLWGDHVFWNAMSGHTKDIMEFYDQCVETMRSLPDGETVIS